MILSGMIELTCLSIHDAGRPAVVGSAVAFTQRADDILKAKLVSHLIEDINIASQLQLTGGNICIAWLEAKNLLSVLFVADADIYCIRFVITFCAFSDDHSFLRKFKSTETVTP